MRKTVQRLVLIEVLVEPDRAKPTIPTRALGCGMQEHAMTRTPLSAERQRTADAQREEMQHI